MAEGDEINSRFAYLLAPIRDLQKNWDVNLDKLLTDYLNDLDTINVDVMRPPSSQITNSQQRATTFAEAALLIQATTQIYSKKVEYLYDLVFKFLELLSKKSLKSRQNQNQNEENAGNRTKPADDGEEQFLELNDIDVNTNVDLNETDENVLKEKAPKLITPMPLALVPLEDFEKSNVPLVAKNGEVIGKKDDYRVNTCCLHSSGVLLLDAFNAKLIDIADEENIAIDRAPTSQPLPTSDNPPFLVVIIQDNDVDVDTSFHASPGAGDAYPQGPSPFMPAETSTLIGPPEPLAASTPAPVANKMHVLLTPQIPQMPPIAEQPNENVKRVSNRKKNVVDDNDRIRLVKEAWLELDEYDVENSPTVREIRKRKTYTVPDSCRSANETKRKGVKRKLDSNEPCNASEPSTTTTRKDEMPKETLADFFKNVVFNKRRNFPKNPLKVPLYGELDDLFWDEQKRRRLTRMRRTIGQQQKDKVADDGRFTSIRNKDAPTLTEEEEIDESQLDRNLKGIFEGPDDEDVDDVVTDENNAEHVGPAVVLTEEDFMPPPPDCHNLSQASERSGTNFATYEEYVKYKVEQHLRKAQQFAVITDLAKRVQEWEERIVPLLSSEEQRQSFDIRKYGDEILEHFQFNKCVEFLFREFVVTKSQWEVCRYFLTSLILANQGNVEVSQTGDLEEALNTMKLKFLSAERHHTHLEDYLAPSVQEKR